MNNNHCSVRDFYYLDLDTPVGRAQIRAELENDFQVPPDVVMWFFEELDSLEERYARLERLIKKLENTDEKIQ